MKRGRKTKFDPKYCEMVKDHMSEGYSFESFTAITGVVKSTLYKWAEDFPEFKEAKEIAEAMALYYHEGNLKKHQEGKANKRAELGATTFPLKTRFNAIYGDKQKHEISGKVEINIDADDAEL